MFIDAVLTTIHVLVSLHRSRGGGTGSASSPSLVKSAGGPSDESKVSKICLLSVKTILKGGVGRGARRRVKEWLWQDIS